MRYVKTTVPKADRKPFNWDRESTIQIGNTRYPATITDAELAQLGYYPYVDDPSTIDPKTERLKRGDIGDTGNQEYTIEAIPPEQVEANRVRLTQQIEREKVIATIGLIDPGANEDNWRDKTMKLTARYTQLVEKKADGETLTTTAGGEADQLAAIKGTLGKVQAIVAASDAIEADPAEDPETSTLWPS